MLLIDSSGVKFIEGKSDFLVSDSDFMSLLQNDAFRLKLLKQIGKDSVIVDRLGTKVGDIFVNYRDVLSNINVTDKLKGMKELGYYARI